MFRSLSIRCRILRQFSAAPGASIVHSLFRKAVSVGAVVLFTTGALLAETSRKKSTDTEDENEKSDGGSLVHLIDLAALYGGLNQQGQENVASLLASVRLANSVIGNQVEAFKEAHKSTPTSRAPALRYSHEISSHFFVGVLAVRGQTLKDERTSIGSRGAYLSDETKLSMKQTGIKIGAGPLDFLGESSGEFSIGYQVDENGGPYGNFAFRRPAVEGGVTVPGSFFFGTGEIKYHTRSIFSEMGYAGGGKWVNFYIRGNIHYATGSLTLTSGGVDAASGRPQPFSFTVIQYPSISGFLMGFETGAVFKFTQRTGFRVGAYYQLALLTFGEPKGFYYNQGVISEMGSSAEITSAAARNQYGFYGITFGIVQKL